jgi:vacuolar protein sorting-associated protein 13A/C
VAYISFNGAQFEYSTSHSARTFTLAFEAIQVDNQLHEGLYPVVLQPTPVSKQVRRSGTPPCLQMSVILSNDEGMVCSSWMRANLSHLYQLMA